MIVGAILVVVGVIWTLQGLDVLGGSGMSGVALWAVIGPFVALIGIVIAVSGRRRR